MRKFRALVAVSVAMLMLACCGNKPGAPASASKVKFDSLQALVSAAEDEGSVVLYADFLPPDDEALAAAWKKKYPSISLKIQPLSGTSLPIRFESEVEAGTPSADVLATAIPDYYRSAAEKHLVVPLRKTGVLDFVPEYPKKYINDDLDTALIQAVPSGLVYNTEKVPADKAPKTWEDLLDPFFKGKVLASPVDAMANANRMLTWKMLRDKYGDDFLRKLGGQLGPLMDFQPMQAAVAAGEAYVGTSALEFVTEDMKSKGAPVDFVRVSPAYWAIHGFGVSAHATHPAAARLLAQFLLTKEGSDAVSGGVGVYGPYDKIPSDFKPPTYEETQNIADEVDTLPEAFKK